MIDREYSEIAKGYTSTVYKLDETRVVKVLDRSSPQRHFEREIAAYQRMEQHEGKPSTILSFFGVHDTIERGIILGFAENSSVDRYLWEWFGDGQRVDSTTLIRWTEQAADALAYVHLCNILHCDIHVSNCFLDHQLNLRIGDFGACALNGEEPLLTYRRTHQLWTHDADQSRWQKDISVNSEMFALGCTMFHMETGFEPFHGVDHDRDREEIARKLQSKEMPSLESTPILGRLVSKCWDLEYRSMRAIVQDLQSIFRNPEKTMVSDGVNL